MNQFDFRIRQSCFKATGHSVGFLDTAITTDLMALIMVEEMVVLV